MGGGSPRSVWIVIALVGIVVIALAIALPLVLLRGDDTHATDTVVSSTVPVTTPTTTAPTTTKTTEPPTTETTQAPTTTTAPPAADIPGDSAGTWAETTISGIEQSVYAVEVSDDALLFQTGGEAGGLYAYLFDSGQTVVLPTGSGNLWGADIDGSLVVWSEADAMDPGSNVHVYAYRLPEGPRREVVSGAGVSYAQVAGGVITWTESRPWDAEPDEWDEHIIKGVSVDESGEPLGAPVTLVDGGSAIGSILGDSIWMYSLSEGFLAWEQHTDAGAIPRGLYVMDLGEMQPRPLGSEAWAPSLSSNRVVFTMDGIRYADFDGATKTLDGAGDFATAAPTFATYFRPTAGGDGTTWAVVTKGYTGAYEQVLLNDTGDPPWFLPPIAASAHHIAFCFDGTVHLFTWQE